MTDAKRLAIYFNGYRSPDYTTHAWRHERASSARSSGATPTGSTQTSTAVHRGEVPRGAGKCWCADGALVVARRLLGCKILQLNLQFHTFVKAFSCFYCKITNPVPRRSRAAKISAVDPTWVKLGKTIDRRGLRHQRRLCVRS